MNFFQKIIQGIKKTKDAFSKKLFFAFSARELDDEFYENLEEALLTADVGVTATENLIEELKNVIFEKKIKKPEDAKELLINLMIEDIDYDIPEYEYPLVILLSGVNGVGKTTAIGKLAHYFKEQGRSVVVAAADTFRAAASEQLEVWGQRAGVRVIRHNEGADPAAVVFDAISSAKAKGNDVILVDTAGRLHNKKNLMAELQKICRVVERELPNADFRKYLVLDATTGQNAVAQAEIFSEDIDTDGIILTKYALITHVGSLGGLFVTLAIFFFAYSTIIANYFYGETNIRFITQSGKTIFAFRAITGATVMIGATVTLQTAWCLVDLAMGLMTLVNLVAIIQLSPKVFRLLDNYIEQRRNHQDPQFKRSMMPEIEKDVECWE